MTTINLFEDAAGDDASRVLPASPRTVEETGLDFLFLTELLCKIMFLRGRISLADISNHVKLPVSVLESVLDFMRAEHLCELASRGDNSASTFFQLSDTGRLRAGDYMRRCQYAGPAPVSLDAYSAQVQRQSIRNVRYTREIMAAGFDGFIIRSTVLDQLGAAMNSGRAMIIYGQPGTGKTFIAENLTRLMHDFVAIPYAITVDNEVIQMYDPHVHELMPHKAAAANLGRKHLVDARWLACKRPIAISGGELTLDTLDLDFDDGTRFYQAPPHVKANNGLFVIDDLGRQLVSPQDLMNRWIVPLDRRRDYLTLHTGYKFQIPFDVIVVFSSNIDPSELADEAFLRRLGYKIHIGALSEDQYRQVFRQVCDQFDIPFIEDALQHLLHEYHYKQGRPLLACYPRDLLGQVRDLALYESRPPALSAQMLDWAWNNYFTTNRQLAIKPSPQAGAGVAGV
ncbi:ATP-binding protein [Herminiimonas sp. CN]|uniref:ATP-binding protein n=1 Tax=Herminiimonas sp. CN TaxID=1349818 RepID=UPI0004740372|nr:ATP-binding protein [Herminiimonas sp. CN]